MRSVLATVGVQVGEPMTFSREQVLVLPMAKRTKTRMGVRLRIAISACLQALVAIVKSMVPMAVQTC
ncbi:MAG: hypothetical protein RL757_1772 [Bacteroidota bacterium]